ncbi:MAG: alpha/beta hydrolase [Candidatus Paceibacterota bacterium]
MIEHHDNLTGNPATSHILETQKNPESKKGRRFSVEVKGHKFDFIEFHSAEPSDTLILHFPGFGEDAEQYAESMNTLMGESYYTLALEGYGEKFSGEYLIEALEQALTLSGKHRVVFHGISFGAGVAYDLISNPVVRDFLKRNNVVGAILEAPVLDNRHLRRALRIAGEKTLMRAGMLFDKMRDLKSLAPKKGLVKLSHSQKESMLSEALREKTTDRKIELPVYVVFSKDESISDNEKIRETLESQAKNMSFSIVASAEDNGHHIADDKYESMWKAEKEIIDGFVERSVL